MLVTLSGLPGSGTSTLARLVAAELGLDHLDGGTVFRKVAAEQGVSLAAYAAMAEHDENIDRALDDRLTDRARQGDVLLESRLAGWLATRAELAALRVWIACDEVERARRQSQDLALLLIDRGGVLIGDDGVLLEVRAGALWALPHPQTAGLLEIRNVGLVSYPCMSAQIALVIALDEDAPRFIDAPEQCERASIGMPLVRLWPHTPALALRAEAALRGYGTNF